jgi:hypothetical protein
MVHINRRQLRVSESVRYEECLPISQSCIRVNEKIFFVLFRIHQHSESKSPIAMFPAFGDNKKS